MNRYLIFKGRNKVTSGYKLPDRSTHGGIDIVGLDSTDVRAVYAGIVTGVQIWDGKTKTGYMSYGNLVKITGVNGDTHYYAHMKDDSIKVKLNQHVFIGDKLGVMGNSGNSFGAHLHFEVRAGKSTATRIDPTQYVAVENKKGSITEDPSYETKVTQSTEPVTTPVVNAINNSTTIKNITYIIKAGDTLSTIAKKYNTTYQVIAKYNKISNPNIITVGQKLTIPTTVTTTTSTTTTTSSVQYYPKCNYNGPFLSTALSSLGVDNTYAFRKGIAKANGITNYSGTSTQNNTMLALLKNGKLKKR